MTLLRTKDGIQNMKLIRTIDGKLNCITQTVWDPTKILSDLKLKTVNWYPKKESIKSTKMGHQAIAVPINAKLYHQHCI